MKKFDSAVILAGGRSSRMGFDKQFMQINGSSIMNNNISKLKSEFNEIIIVTNKPEQYKGSSYKIENSISSESKSLFSLVKTLDFELIEENKVKEFDENLNIFLNLNTKEDVDRYITLMERRNS